MFNTSGVVLMMTVLLLGGCTPSKLWNWSSAQLQALVEDPDSMCTPKDGEDPLSATELLAKGHAYLQGAPTSQNADQSIYCFNRALRTVPESYEAQLGLGIAFLTVDGYVIP